MATTTTTTINENMTIQLPPPRNPTIYNETIGVNWMFEYPVISFQPMVFQIQSFRHAKFMNNDNNAMKILDQLYALGMDYLYGMLFHELFTFQPDIYPPEFNQNNNKNNRLRPPTRTYVLHSRHYSNADTGRDTKKEKDCLHSILDKNESIDLQHN